MHVSDSQMTFIGFTSWKTTQQTVTFINDYDREVVSFEKTLVNSGEFYSSASSSFRCAFDGVYFVTFTLYTPASHHVDVGVFNSSDISQISVYNKGVDTMSNSAIVYCETNNTLAVKTTWSTSVIAGDVNIPYTTFTVFMVHNVTMSKSVYQF